MRLKHVPLIAACFALFSLPALAGDWPGFRGPGSLGASDETNLPLKWSDTENLVWNIDLPGSGASSPIVWGDKVFVTCYTGYGVDRRNPGNQEYLARHVLCVDRKTGKVLWNKEVKAKLPELPYTGFMLQHGYASSTPATDGERVYDFQGKTGVFAYDFGGKELWHADVGDQLARQRWGTGSSPVLYKDFVIVSAGVESDSLIALNKKTGKQEWKTPGISGCWGSPVLLDGPGGKPEVVLSLPNTVRSFDPETGKELWKCTGLKDSYLCTSVVAKDGIVYVIGARNPASAMAIKAGGTGDVTTTNVLWRQQVGSRVPSPVVFGEHLYWVNDTGMVYCLKTRDGVQVYKERLNGEFYASFTVGDGKIYAVSKTAGTFVLALGPKFEQLAQNKLTDDSIFNGSPAISQGQLFLRSDKRLYCIGKK
jgi:outer membrane protein assembly factor BamB